MIWGQQTPRRCDYFRQRYGQWHNISVQELPHFQYVKGDKEPYVDYLKKSWQTTDEEKIKEQLKKFDDLISDIKENDCREPIIVCKDILVDGNHRAVICEAFDIEYKQKEISICDWVNFQYTGLSQYAKNESGFYQSFRIGDKYFVGRRIEKNIDVTDKIVWDLGCNIGGNCYNTKAKKIIGFDLYEDLIIFALRLNCFYHNDNVEFFVHDLNKPIDLPDPDVIFAFSIEDHIKDKRTLLETLKKAKTVYFETHEHGQSDLIKEFKVEFLYNTDNGIHSTARNRKLYRLT